jgi:predicted ester cyclase
MKFESNTSSCKDNSENEEYVFDDTEDGTIEPSIDYNDKQVRFSSIVLDTEVK